MKKLQLKKQVVAKLGRKDLGQVVGGGIPYSEWCPTGFDTECAKTKACDSEQICFVNPTHVCYTAEIRCHVLSGMTCGGD